MTVLNEPCHLLQLSTRSPALPYQDLALRALIRYSVSGLLFWRMKMSLTEQQKEIALRVAGVDPEVRIGICWSQKQLVEFATRFLAALPKPEAVGHYQGENKDGSDCVYLYHDIKKNQLLFAESPIAPPASEQKPVGKVIGRNFGCVPRVEWYDSYPKSGSLLYAAPQPDYKAQRDALLDFANHIATAPKLVGTGWQEMAQMVVASAKGGA